MISARFTFIPGRGGYDSTAVYSTMNLFSNPVMSALAIANGKVADSTLLCSESTELLSMLHTQSRLLLSTV